ncbi:MAG: hypothetical protein AMS25_15020 [Gemmatimonas sp. SM23_52]|nr:MAG: hypothetical protein AMS25_15020 [Gemmatimonas sp. SM23_52]
MCGYTDFQALGTCITRFCALSAAGALTYAAWRTQSAWHVLRCKLRDAVVSLCGYLAYRGANSAAASDGRH